VIDRTRTLLLIPVVAIVGLAPLLAAAQELEEIIVTAERRETTVLKTPISIEVFTADALAADQLKSVKDLENATPNLTINTTGFTVQSVNIRGIGNSVVNPNIAPGVAVFQDGLLMAETVVLQQGFLDVATIEVLRGPQGTFVGQSSTGGAIRINAVRPDFQGINGFFDGSLGSKTDTKFSGALNLPLSDKISTRFAFNKENRDSFFRNIGYPAGPTMYRGGRQPGKVDDSNLRASILWEPNEKLSVLGRIEFNTSQTDALAPYQPNRATYVNPNDPTGRGISQYAPFAVPGNDPYVIAWDMVNPENRNESDRYSIDVRRKLGHGLEFRSLTGYQHNDLRTGDDPDATTANSGIFLNDVGPTNDYWSQEFNLLSPADGKVTWIVGTSWFRRTTPVNVRSDNNLCGYNGATGIVTPCLPAGALPIQTAILTIDTTQQHAGLFGQLTWKASDKIELQFGARQSWDHNSDEQHIFVALNTQIVGGPPTNCPDPRFTAVLPAQGVYNCFPVSPGNVVPYADSTPTYKVGVNWTPGSNQLIYAFYARGYKSGGINNGIPFQPENVNDIEIGWKTAILGRRLQIQVGAFDMDYKNMQQPAFLVEPFGSGLSQAGAIQNIGSSTVKGVEASLNGAFGEFGFQFGVGYVESDLGGITTIDPRLLSRTLLVGNNNYVPGCNPGQTPIVTGGIPNCYDYSTSPALRSLSGAANLYSPKLSYNLSLNYGFSLRNGAKLRPRVAFAHVDKSYASLFQTDDFFKIDARNLRNLSVTYETETWELQAFCNNCSDQHYIAAVEGGTGNRVIYGDPETIGLRFHKKF
jgi:iron complex outermembrane receptor protein